MHRYDNKTIRVTFDPGICVHSGNCVRGLPSVFDVNKKPWVTLDGASAEAVEAAVKACPSGALRFERLAP